MSSRPKRDYPDGVEGSLAALPAPFFISGLNRRFQKISNLECPIQNIHFKYPVKNVKLKLDIGN
jgi:hypothetical protein